jgi:hypothetical protein
MRHLVSGALALLVLAAAGIPPAGAADDSKVKAATKQVERGAQKIGQGKIGEGVEETAKGIGRTLVEGSRYTGEKLKESGKAAEPEAKSAWANARDGAVSFGRSVKSFITSLFSGQ